jgi:hypothetical protein
VNDLHGQRPVDHSRVQAQQKLGSLFERVPENQADAAGGNVHDPGRSTQLLARDAYLTKRFEPAGAPGDGTSLAAGARRTFLVGSDRSLRNRWIS